MNSFHLPGYYWYVKGEIPITTQVDIDTIIPVCTDVLYSSFQRLGFDEFSSEVLARIPKANRTKSSLNHGHHMTIAMLQVNCVMIQKQV